MNELRRLWPYLRPYRGRMLLSGFCLVLATPCQLFHPLVWKFIVDEVVIAGQASYLPPALIVMLTVHFAGTALSSWRTYQLGCIGRLFVNDLRNDVYAKLQRQSVGYFHNRRAGDISARVINDVEALEDVIVHGVDSVIANVLSFLFVAAVIITLQWVVGTLTLIPLLVVAVLIHRFNNRVKTIYRAVRERLGETGAKLHENLAGMAVIKAFARDAEEVARFGVVNARHRDAGLRGVRARAFYMPSVMLVGFVSNAIMIGLGAVFVLRGEFSIGGLIAYRGYWWQLFSPIQSLAQINDMLQRAKAAAHRVFELLDDAEEVTDAPDAESLTRPQGRIAFDRVTFAYAGGATVLHDVSFAVEPGQTIGIVGPSGGGKSTLLHLLLRFYDPTAGRITLDGHDLRAVTQASLRRAFGVVSQEAFLFHDTVRNNLRYGRLDADDAEIETAARQANAQEFIEHLPQGYDTVLGERGVKLSGGQRQRLCIARAFVADPAILLLDEATAAVEPESEMLIQAALQRLMQGRTTMIVSHRLSMVRDAHAILVIQRGRLVETGNHAALMAHDGWYARMYRLQMGE